ncbi:MAG TPA: hypothetical protein VNA21_07155 [Steroidobacteraceae bacterium]|nr:hypothetical protein [Steroidobacteraceae bacterium]
MNKRSGSVYAKGISLLLTYLLLCGCDGRADRAAQTPKADSVQTQVPPQSMANEGARARSDAEQDALKRQRMAALSQELQAARAQQTTLMQRQADMSARIAAQQEEGMALLASLKAQMKSQADAERSANADPEAFKKDARMQLEAALEQDDQLTAEFESLTSELRSVDSRVSELSAQLDSLRAGTAIR